jgi:hypothetical protein
MYSESKYRLRIFPPQGWDRDFAHARCFPSFIGKPQTWIRKKQIVFTYCSVRLKCSRWSSAPDCEIQSVIRFLNARDVKPADTHRQICEVRGENAMSDGMLRKWVRKFNDDRDNVHEEPRSGRTSVVSGGYVVRGGDTETGVRLW